MNLLLLLLLLKYFPNKYNLDIMLTVSGIYELKCRDPVFCVRELPTSLKNTMV
jgi:hypothetical protein